ncbi:hypothetical protein, conserved [Eimeria brunetti]|uniref:Transmembrane protein n=1 Tax=Eimeria brunetti TaxID=51314 RepID=U6LGM7_9EIME|nr:hypothetical protein, conserved [Eimeria brunetti]
MGFHRERRSLGLYLVLILGVGVQISRFAVAFEILASAATPHHGNPWNVDRASGLGVRNAFFDVSEDIPEEAGLRKTTHVKATSKGRRRAWRRLAILVALSISVAVALQFRLRSSSSFLRRGQQPVAPPTEEPQRNERLEKVRGLAKSASMITAALQTPGAEELMGRLQEDLNKAEKVQREGGTAEEIEASLDGVMDCVQMLHTEIIEHADAAVKANKVISLYPLIDAKDPNPIEEIESLETLHETAVSPFLQSLSSMYNVSEALFLRTKTIHAELKKSEVPAQDEDGKWLQSTALKVNSLFSTMEAQRHVERLARGLVSGSLSGLKVTMLAEREAKRLRLQLSLDVAHMHLQQIKGALQNISVSAKKEASVNDKKAVLNGIEKELQGISVKVSELLVPSRNLRTSETLREIFAVCTASQEVEDEVSAHLERILGVLTEFEPKADDLDKASKKAMGELIDKYRKLFAQKHEVTQRAYYDVEERVGNVIHRGILPSATTMQRQHARVAQNIRDKMNQTMEQSEQEVSYGESALLELKTVGKLSTAAQVMEVLKVIGNSIIHMKEEALLQLLSIHLVNILQQDIIHIAKEEATITLDPDYPHVDQQKMHALQSNFNAAKKTAELSGTVQEMAAAAAAMRTYYTQIEELLCEQRRKS